VHVAPLAQPRKHAAVGIVHDQPFESRGLTVELVQCRGRAIEAIEVAHQRLDAGVLRLFQEMPIERMVVPPLVFLSELAAMNRSFLPGWPNMKP